MGTTELMEVTALVAAGEHVLRVAPGEWHDLDGALMVTDKRIVYVAQGAIQWSANRPTKVGGWCAYDERNATLTVSRGAIRIEVHDVTQRDGSALTAALASLATGD